MRVTRYFGRQYHPADGGEGPSLVGPDVLDSSSAARGEGGTNLSKPCAETREDHPKSRALEVDESATQVGTRSRFVGTELAAPLQPMLTPFGVSTRSHSFGSCEGWSLLTSLVIQAEP
jgi:hypothetical protein